MHVLFLVLSVVLIVILMLLVLRVLLVDVMSRYYSFFLNKKVCCEPALAGMECMRVCGFEAKRLSTIASVSTFADGGAVDATDTSS